jgi:hypothetical protein
VSDLRATRSPNLNVAPSSYDARQQEQFANQLRLYFAQVDNANTELIKEVNNLNVMTWLGLGGF